MSRSVNATFSDFRIVKGRKVLQLFMEVPIEQMLPTLTILGQPGIHDDKWCRIELIEDREEIEFEKPKGGDANSQNLSDGQVSEGRNRPDNAAPQAEQSAPSGAKRKFSDFPLSNQAGMRCKDQQFWAYLRSEGWECISEYDAKQLVYGACGVQSLSELGHAPKAALAWINLERHYQDWLTTQKYEGSRRP